jgi:acetyl-CoA acyltransferase
MGATAELVAKRFEIPRQAQDEFALQSQQRAAAAKEAGKLKDELFPVITRVHADDGKPSEVTVTFDTIMRPDTTAEGLAKLKPAFDAQGTVTAGNASPLTDGAAAAVLMSEAKAKSLGLSPLGYFVDLQVAGVPPEIMGIGPVPAVRKLLAKNGLKVQDIDLFELNEAFAAVVLKYQKDLGVPADRLNVNGGAIAMGHPLGATGAMILGTVLDELERRDGDRAVVTLCIGGGMGVATVIERVRA